MEPAFGKKSVHDIKRGDIQAAVDKAKPSTGRQMRALLQRLFTYGRWLEIPDHDPSHFVETDAWESRDRVLVESELRAIWQVLEEPSKRIDAKINEGLAAAIKLCALTLQRRGEVAGCGYHPGRNRHPFPALDSAGHSHKEQTDACCSAFFGGNQRHPVGHRTLAERCNAPIPRCAR
jgi:integrase